MKIIQLLEGTEPKMPGAPKGIQIMTPQQFVAKAGDMPGEDEQELEEAKRVNTRTARAEFSKRPRKDALSDKEKEQKKSESDEAWERLMAYAAAQKKEQGVAEGYVPSNPFNATDFKRHMDTVVGKVMGRAPTNKYQVGQIVKYEMDPPQEGGSGVGKITRVNKVGDHYEIDGSKIVNHFEIKGVKPAEQGVAEGEEHLARIRKLSGLDEATKLPASSREFGGDEFQDYMKRIVGTPDLDKEGNPKVDKKGIEKYVSGKTKSDKYKMPYIHRSSVIEYLGPDGKTYDENKIKQALAERPKKLLKQNEKMKHSNGELEQFFNIGFAALTGIALDEDTNKLIIVNTCPGAGSCKIDCFAMKGGKVQFKAAWLSDGRILTYLLNDPDGFFNQLSSEISKEEKLGQKGGYKVTIRWHDAGDFFSPEYVDMAFKLANAHPDVQFYAYTKMGDVATGANPNNFIINWSEGAHTSQEKKVKQADPNLERTKNSRIVPNEVFYDLLVKDEKKNLVKGAKGQWQVIPDKLPELKQRIAKEYGISANSILSYDEWDQKTDGGKKETPVKYNVIIAPGEPDITAKSHGVLSTLLLKH